MTAANVAEVACGLITPAHVHHVGAVSNIWSSSPPTRGSNPWSRTCPDLEAVTARPTDGVVGVPLCVSQWRSVARKLERLPRGAKCVGDGSNHDAGEQQCPCDQQPRAAQRV